MSTDRKLLIGAGALLLVLMSSIIAFSVGVYVGVKGWGTQPALIGQRTNQPDPLQNGQPQDRALPQERPALTGLLMNGNRSMIALRTKEGVRQVAIEKELVITRWDGETVTPGDLERGMALALFGKFDEDEKTLRVNRIVVLPPAEEKGQG